MYLQKKFLKGLKGYIHECFEKVKIVDKPNKELEELYKKKKLYVTNVISNSVKKI